jgi:hypothetical protein
MMGIVEALFTRSSGWVLVVLLATTITLPYLLRGAVPASKGRPAPDFLQRLRPHFWLGYAILGLVFAHAWVAMSAGGAGRADLAGLFLATGALVLVVVQVAVGLNLRDLHRPGRRKLRRAHFWVMVGIATLAIGHIALDSGSLRAFLG